MREGHCLVDLECLISLAVYLQWRSKVVGTLVKTVQKITKESFRTTIVIFKGTISA